MRVGLLAIAALVLLGLGLALITHQPERSSLPAPDPQPTDAASPDRPISERPPISSGSAETGARPIRPGQAARTAPRPDFAALNGLMMQPLYARAAELRAWAETGWAEAVVPWLRIVRECIDRPPQTEQEMNRRFSRSDDAANHLDPEQRRVRQVRIENMRDLERQRRAACDSVLPDDPARILDWLELALAAREPGFLAGYLKYRLIPEDKDWVISHAERLAEFNPRFVQVYLEQLRRGNLELLGLAWKIYSTRLLLPDPDLRRMHAWMHAAERAAREHSDFHWRPPQRLSGQRSPDNPHALSPQQLREAEALGDELYERCCVEARMPR